MPNFTLFDDDVVFLSSDGSMLERLRSPQGPDDDLKGLTDQERRILDLIAEGLTNRQIGERMYLARRR